MRIVHVANFFMPMLGYQERYLAYHHAKMGHNVSILTSALRHPLGEYQWLRGVVGERAMSPGIYNYEVEKVQVIRLHAAFEFRHRVWLTGVEKAIRKLDPDVVVLHGMN